ncbi:hypothetical protein MJ1HA_1121 [Metallosphaera sedula]|nr:hypothetical protein MJ1HA_1121 [Metallosphaera sedula]
MTIHSAFVHKEKLLQERVTLEIPLNFGTLTSEPITRYQGVN